MKRIVCFALTLVLVSSNLFSQAQQEPIPWPTLSNSAWPMIKHDPQFTGRSPYKGPQTPTIVWTADLPYGIFSGPVLDINQNLYFGAYYQSYSSTLGADYFYSYTIEGLMNWNVRLGNDSLHRPPQTGILIDSSNTIYFGSLDGYFYALNMDGTVKWKYQTEPMVELVWPNIDLEGNLYIVNGKSGELVSIHPDGTLNWKVRYGDGFIEKSPAISPDGQTIYIFGKISNLYAINLDGSLKWTFSKAYSGKAPVIDNQGNLYFVNEELPQSLSSLKPDGTLRWKSILSRQTGLTPNSVPTIDKDGNILLIGVDTTLINDNRALISIDFWGKVRWIFPLFEITNFPDDFWQPLICDNEGTVYVGSTFGKNYYAISNEGKLKWQLPLNDYQVDNTGAIGEDGTLYLGVHKSSLFYGTEKNLIAIRDTGTVGIENAINGVKDFLLYQNYPNPFNPSTSINYQIPKEGIVTLKVYDILGNEMKTLVNEFKSSGNYSVEFDASKLASGMYLYRLQVNQYVSTKKMLLLK